MKFLSSAFAYFFIWILNTIKAKDMFPVVILVHDGICFDVVDQNAEKDYTFFKLIMLACPAEGEELGQNEFVNHQTGSSLIIRKIVQPEFDLGHLNYNICKKQYSPNIFAHEATKTYMFGYSFYFNDEQLKIIYDTVSKGSGSWEWDENETGLIKVDKNYFWYMPMLVQLNNKSMTSSQLVNPNEYVGNVEKCTDFSLGISFVEDKDIERFYEKDTQMPILDKFVKPYFNENELDEMYLIKQQLTPFHDFDTYSKRLCTCSYLNIAPMWKTIANGSWKRTEKFIKNLTEFAKIEIVTGTLETLRLPKSDYPHEMESVFLNKTPVPEAFWKLIKYSVSAKRKPVSMKGIVIVTFNYVSTTAALHNPLCSQNVCEILGWEVGNEDYKTGFTYCCRVNKEVMERLGKIDEDVDASIFTDFDLRDPDRGDGDSNNVEENVKRFEELVVEESS